MFVLCPHCQFLVAVDPATGLPPERCPRCDGIVMAQAEPPAVKARAASGDIEAADTAQADIAPVPEAALTAAEEAPVAPGPSLAPVTPAAPVTSDASTTDEPLDGQAPPATLAETGSAPAAPPSPMPPPPPSPSPSPERAPSFAGAARAAIDQAKPARGWQVAAIAGLAVLLAVQILVADRGPLAADARWRPAMAALCVALHCDLPAWREPSAITLLDRDVAADPSHPGVLRVTASFRNDARWPQPWPKLVLTLSDVDGRVAGARAFEPREYLGRTATKNGLASGQVAHVAMDIIEPAPRIVAFTFDFR